MFSETVYSRGATKSATDYASNLRKKRKKNLKSPHNVERKEFTGGTDNFVGRRGRVSGNNPHIVPDEQPITVCFRGFRRLICVLESRYEIPSHHGITDAVLPKLHDSVKKIKRFRELILIKKKNLSLS